MPSRPKQIRDLPFRHGNKPLAIEVFRLSDLYERARRGRLDHALDAPQRPEFHTIYVGTRGRGTLVVDFTPVPLGAGYVTIVARGRVQQFVPDVHVDRPSAPLRGAARPNGAGACDAWMILVEPAIVGIGPDDPLRSPSVLSPAWPLPAIELPAGDRRELLALVEQLDTEHARALDAVQPAILTALVRVLLLRVERLQTGWRATTSTALEQFFTILERDCLTTRAVSHYARASAISPRRLGELLVEHTGKTTKQVIDERVVLEHKRLLVHTDLSVKQIAAATGFDEPTNLVKFFRLHAGMTPLEFRDRHTFLPSARRSSPRRRRSDDAG